MPFKSVAVLDKEIQEIKKILEEKIAILEEKLNQSIAITKPVEIRTNNPELPEIKNDVARPPIAPEYRQLVNEVLNSKFGLNVDYSPTEIIFEIVVPEDYTPLSKSELETRKVDLRTARISYALGLNGARQWCEKVYKSFTAEMQSKITAER